MATPGLLPIIAQQHNESLDTLIPRTVEEAGSVLRAAQRLGVAPNTINNWLASNDLFVETTRVTKVLRRSKAESIHA